MVSDSLAGDAGDWDVLIVVAGHGAPLAARRYAVAWRHPSHKGAAAGYLAGINGAVMKGGNMVSSQDAGPRRVDLGEAARQLELAAHDARVAFDCVGLGEIDRAHTHAITARAAADAAENVLRAALAGDISTADQAR
jgi:hypothetical protein